jgi:hypothetical protein
MKLRDVVRQDQLCWGDIAFGPVSGEWPAISFARGTNAVSQLRKLKPGGAIVSVCVGSHAPAFRDRVTGVMTAHDFTALTAQLVEPSTYQRSAEEFGHDRWPSSIAIRQAWRFAKAPFLSEITDIPREITMTRGRYLAPLDGQIYSRLADLEVEEIELYRSSYYNLLVAQPTRAAHRQAGYVPSAPKDIQGVIEGKVKAVFAAARDQGRLVCRFEQADRRVSMSELDLSLVIWELWEAQNGRCAYCTVPLETQGLAQVSIDRIDNSNREYGQHNVQLTCWECNRGKGPATDEEMRTLWEKRRRAWREDAGGSTPGAEDG